MTDATSLPQPRGAPEGLVVEGILDGRVADAEALHAAVDELGRAGAGSFRADVTGGRFSLLPDDTHVPPDRFDEDAQATFVERLQRVVGAALPGSVETNLRCKLVYRDQVAETLFVVRGGVVEAITRRRPRTVGDAQALPPGDVAARLPVRRRELVWLAPVLLLVGLLVAWQSGWIDRVLAARADGLRLDTGPFVDMLAITTERSWGVYSVELRRAAGYPTTPAELAARRDGSANLTERAACEVVGDGGTLFVQLMSDDGQVLDEARVELRALLTDPAGVTTARLPGRMAASGVRLSLSEGRKPK
jgi:hypothetical protein